MKIQKIMMIIGLFFMVTVQYSFANKPSSSSNPDRDPLKEFMVLYATEIVYPAVIQVITNKIARSCTDGYPTFKAFMLCDEDIEDKQLDEIVRVFDAASF